MCRNFSADGFGLFIPKYKDDHPPKFALGQRREIKKIAKSKTAEHGLPFSTSAWSSWPSSWWARGWSTTSATRACGFLLRQEGVTFQHLKTWKKSKDLRYAA